MHSKQQHQLRIPANSGSDSSKESKSSGGSNVNLSIADGIFSEEAVHGLIDDWIVPTLVEAYLRNLVEANERSKDNGSQP